jgi:acetylglutamate kinase
MTVVPVIRWLSLPRVRELSRDAVIRGGMLPKLDACKHALLQGVGRVTILPAEKVEAVAEFYFAKNECGPEVWTT